MIAFVLAVMMQQGTGTMPQLAGWAGSTFVKVGVPLLVIVLLWYLLRRRRG